VLRKLDQQLSTVSPQFSDNVLKASNAFEMWISDASDLAGLPPSAVEAASEAAKEKGKPGQYLFTLQIPSYMPFMTYSERRPLREKMYRAYSSRAFRDEFSNEGLTKQIAQLRHDRAALLGQQSHAEFVLQERMAETPEKAHKFLENILVKARPAAERDLEQVKALKLQETGEADFQSWDYAYWSEKLKRKLHNIDEEELRQYFKLENVIEGVFEHARKLYGLEFKEVKDLPLYHPDVRVFEVTETTGRFIGLFYTDFFPRASKQGGAWASSLRRTQRSFAISRNRLRHLRACSL
jgi:peptidyl-dipeptidase Dcp